MEKELVIRDPENKRIKQMIKIDISAEIQAECKRSLDFVLFQQSQQISQLFEFIDQKHTYGIMAEIGTAILGIDEFNSLDADEKKLYQFQYHICFDKLCYSLINLCTQLIFSLARLPDNLLDQTFIKKTIEMIYSSSEVYINKSNNIFSGQKEVLNGLIKKLIELYNQKLNTAILLCEQNNSFWERTLIFSQSINQGCTLFDAFANVLIYSENQNQFKNYLIANKLNINFIESLNLEYNKKYEIPNTKFCIEELKSGNLKEARRIALKKHAKEAEKYLKNDDNDNFPDLVYD